MIKSNCNNVNQSLKPNLQTEPQTLQQHYTAMKHLTKTFLIFLFLSLSIGSCKKDDDGENGTPQDSMAEYFYCKINGVEFNPYSTSSCNSRLFGYYPEAGDGIEAGYMVIRGRDCETTDVVALRFSGFTAGTGQVDLLEPTIADSCYPIFGRIFPDILTFDSLLFGSMNLVHFSPSTLPNGALGLVEGTFEFSVANAELDSTVHITEGNFRFRIQQTW